MIGILQFEVGDTGSGRDSRVRLDFSMILHRTVVVVGKITHHFGFDRGRDHFHNGSSRRGQWFGDI